MELEVKAVLRGDSGIGERFINDVANEIKGS